MTPQYPIRKQRKAENRERLILAAQELFQLNGYKATTMAGVAERAGLHNQTLYRHFKSKVELAAAGGEAQLAHFQAGIEDDQRTDTTIQFWREYVARAVNLATGEDQGRNYRELLHHFLESPSISSHIVQSGQQYQALLAASLVRDVNVQDPEERLEIARLVAITLWGAHDDVQRRHEREENYDLASETLAAIDWVEKLFAHVLVSSS